MIIRQNSKLCSSSLNQKTKKRERRENLTEGKHGVLVEREGLTSL